MAVDIANPSKRLTIPLAKAWDYFHVPLAGPEGNVMVFSDFTDASNQGNVGGYGGPTKIWESAGKLVPQPVLGTNGDVYFIQGGELKGHLYNRIGEAAIAAGKNLATTSNLVMDGANDVYFWNHGALYGYSQLGGALFTPGKNLGVVEDRLETGPQKFIRLMMGPDGTAWANNKNGSALYAFEPVYADEEVTLTAKDMATQTAYRATGKLAVAEGDVTLKAGTTTLLQGGSGVAARRGFRVEKGASLLCRAGR